MGVVRFNGVNEPLKATLPADISAPGSCAKGHPLTPENLHFNDREERRHGVVRLIQARPRGRIDQVLSRHSVKKQQMRWLPETAHTFDTEPFAA
jgi:hypothetical protein